MFTFKLFLSLPDANTGPHREATHRVEARKEPARGSQKNTEHPLVAENPRCEMDVFFIPTDTARSCLGAQQTNHTCDAMDTGKLQALFCNPC